MIFFYIKRQFLFLFKLFTVYLLAIEEYNSILAYMPILLAKIA
jgi:hypothetical protein